MSAKTISDLFFCPVCTARILISLRSNLLFFPIKKYSAILYYKDLVLCQSLPNAYCVYSMYYACLFSIIKIMFDYYAYFSIFPIRPQLIEKRHILPILF